MSPETQNLNELLNRLETDRDCGLSQAAVEKKAPVGERTNIVFSGCSVTYGTAFAVVAATGMKTEMGKIAGILVGEEEGKTPFQEKLAKLGGMLGMQVLGVCFVMFAVQLVREGRGIFENVKKVVGFLLSANLAEVLTVFISTVILGSVEGLGNPFIPIQLLWIKKGVN